ncbi:Pentatricopeptide repeat-containing protein [Cynara cardunculus var. scolymus]|uniref:Pentatricopeptide repeat-containing protein n=1 Tax=Cynara cardunculus var. scolymus TaxID=59895 RepID=A0A118K7M2_CYNCS|nr:Pentatricopeptide repeat-containing protein [Cynara cardunculus var. scolymus]
MNYWELDVILGTSFINMYVKCGRIQDSLFLFLTMKDKNVFTWNSIIKGLAMDKNVEKALWWFSRMKHEKGIKPDEVTLIVVSTKYQTLRLFGRSFSAFGSFKRGHGSHKGDAFLSLVKVYGELFWLVVELMGTRNG